MGRSNAAGEMMEDQGMLEDGHAHRNALPRHQTNEGRRSQNLEEAAQKPESQIENKRFPNSKADLHGKDRESSAQKQNLNSCSVTSSQSKWQHNKLYERRGQ